MSPDKLPTQQDHTMPEFQQYLPYPTRHAPSPLGAHSYIAHQLTNGDGRRDKEEDDDEEESEDGDKDGTSDRTVTARSHHSNASVSSEEEYEEEAPDTKTPRMSAYIHIDKLSDGQFWSCITCWDERHNSSDNECAYCQEITSTIKRWMDSKRPVATNADGDEIAGEDVETSWICAICHEPKLYVGGKTSSDPIFKGDCANCRGTTATVYADHRTLFCCAICRFERTDPREDEDEDVDEYEEWCGICQRDTDFAPIGT